MLGSISPVGEASRGQRWWLTATAYVLGSAAGGATIGLVLGGLGAGVGLLLEVPLAIRVAILAGVALLGGLVDAGVLHRRLPTWHRQVDETWLPHYRGWVYGLGFGLQLGTGIATIVPAAITYVALAAALLTFSWQGGLLVGLVFGVVRAVPVLLSFRLRSAPQLYAATRRLERAAPAAHRLTVAGQLVAGVTLVLLLAAA